MEALGTCTSGIWIDMTPLPDSDTWNRTWFQPPDSDTLPHSQEKENDSPGHRRHNSRCG